MKTRHILPILLALTGALHAQGPVTDPFSTPNTSPVSSAILYSPADILAGYPAAFTNSGSAA